MPTLPVTERKTKDSISAAETRMRRLETTATRLLREIEDMRDLLEIRKARVADEGKRPVSIAEARRRLGL